MKIVLLAGMVAMTGAASLVAAEVTSINAVGFANVTIPTGFSMIANPLAASSSTLSSLLSSAPAGTQVFKFNGSTFDNALHLGGGNWINGGLTLVPGEGAFVQNTSGSQFSVTFVGEVQTGNLVNPVPAGFSIRSSQVPQSGAVSTLLGLPVVSGDQIFVYNNAGDTYQNSLYLGGGNWIGGEPSISVGQSFWILKSAAVDWTRSFSVN